MKKVLTVLLGLSLILTLAACGANSTSKSSASASGSTTTSTEDDKTITVAASPTPHAEILEVAGELLKKEGYTLEVKEFNDYVLPNTATEDGQVDANFFQHTPYLEDFNKENGTHLVAVGKIHFEPLSIYAGKTKDLADLPDGATVIVPNDTTNEARALLLLEAQGLIKLDPNAGLTATKTDIVENPKNLQIEELEAAQLPRSLQDADIGVINGNYALQGGLTKDDVLAVESSDSDAAQTYANVLVVKEGNENLPKIQALYKALTSDEVRDFINEHYQGSVVPVF